MMEVQRVRFDKPTTIKAHDTIEVFCLTEGKEVLLECANNTFKQFIVHYGEAFIIPAGVNEFTISPVDGDHFVLIKAHVKR